MRLESCGRIYFSQAEIFCSSFETQSLHLSIRLLQKNKINILLNVLARKSFFVSPAGGAVHSLLSGWLPSELQHQNSARLAGVKPC